MRHTTVAIVCAMLVALTVLCGCGAPETVPAPSEIQTEVTEQPIPESAAAEVTEQPAYDVDEARDEYFDVGSSSAGGIDEAEYEKYKDEGEAAATAGTAPVLDEYYTSPVPDGMPLPVEPGETGIDTGTRLSCTLLIDCSLILNNMDKLRPEKNEVLPSDGVIYAKKTVTFSAGESVFDVLLRETQNNRIHMEYNMTPIYNSNYIEGIGNLYEFDCGDLSGWMYNVNGWYPNYGCSRYQLKDGDAVEWRYTCDLGRDLGVDWIQQ